MNESQEQKHIKNLVYTIRGQQVMLDSDLAKLYNYEVGQFNRQVKRNIERFPDDFMMQLTEEEYKVILKCQIGIPSGYGGRRFLPYAFTEQGIYMLTSVLKSEVAIQQSIFVIRAFKEMRHYIVENQPLFNNNDLLKLSKKVNKNKKDIFSMKSTIDKIMDNFIDPTNIKEITILNGHKFDAMEAYHMIYQQAKKSIYIIDDYINIKTLSLLKCKKQNVNVIIFSDNKGINQHCLEKNDVIAFNSQYPQLTIKANGIVHDRYIVIDYDSDNEIIYHCGASSKDAGKKVCTINKLHESYVLHTIIETLLKHKKLTLN